MTSLLQIQVLQQVPAANGERTLLHDPSVPRQNLARIDALIQRTENKERLKLLCRAWWKEWFRVYCGERKSA